MTPKEAKAISLVKDKWTEKFGNTDGIDFNISIQNDGKYLVTVYDTKTTQTISGYIVDVTTGIINENRSILWRKRQFRRNYKRVRKIATELENGDLSLEDSVSKFEEGMKLSKQCNDLLENAEKESLFC